MRRGRARRIRKMNLILFGDSHIVSIGNGFADLIKANPSIGSAVSVRACKLLSFPESLSDFFVEQDGAVRLHSVSGLQSFMKILGSDTIKPNADVTFGLCLPYTTNVLLRRSLWRNCQPYPCDSSKQVISLRVFEEIVLAHFAKTLAFVELCCRVGIQIFIIESPPIRDDDLSVSNGLPVDDALRIDRMARLVVTNKLNSMKIPIVNLFEAAFAGEPNNSVLNPDFNGAAPNDTMHANRIFGQRYARHILNEQFDIS